MQTRSLVDEAVAVLESLAMGSVAITTLALGQAGVELTFAQWRVLMVLAERPDGATVSEVAGRIGSANSPASRLIDRMRRRGLVVTSRDESDHRATRVRLAAQGWAVRDLVMTRRRELLREAVLPLEPLSAEARQRLTELASALRAMP